jgi:superfamily I DNA and/or RNA helicase
MLSTGDRGAVAGALGLALTKALTGCGAFSVSSEQAYEVATSIIQAAYQIPSIETGEADKASLELFHKVQAVLDTGPRLAAFQYASRYWEGRWLLSRMYRFQNQAQWTDVLARTATEQGMPAAIRLDMDEQLFLAPCVVATAHTLPMIFGIFGRPEAAFGVADEMIVDEAGQAPQELIAPVSAFAKRAIFLGDTQQIQPVRAFTPERDSAMIRSFVASEQLPADVIPDTCRVSAGSVMEMAVESSNFTALTLRYHYRCRPSIIAWSNDYCYGGALIPVRPEYEPREEDEAIPMLGYIRVSGKADRTTRGSIANPTEAAAAADWLFNHKAEIESRFGAPLHECVAVLTPYARQNIILKRLLQNRFKDHPDVILPKMIIGSVHQIQGAERPLVLFSAAVNTAPGAAFFDRTPNLLNVARSRATESFILLAAPAMLDRTDDKPFGRFAADIKARGRRLYTTNVTHDPQQPRPGAEVEAISMVAP